MTPESVVNPAVQWRRWSDGSSGKERPGDGLGRAKTEAPTMGDGENEEGPESRLGRSASVRGAIPGAG